MNYQANNPSPPTFSQEREGFAFLWLIVTSISVLSLGVDVAALIFRESSGASDVSAAAATGPKTNEVSAQLDPHIRAT